MQSIGGSVTRGFVAAISVAVFIALIGVLPWQDAIENRPAIATEWWFRPAMVLAAYAIVAAAAVWNRWKVKK